MKKSLLVAALIAGFAGAAHAETSVTLYGIVDAGVGYQQFKGKNGDDSFKAHKSGTVDGIQSSSRWGLKGAEDLGDGLKAVFVLEQGFKPMTGSGSGFDRQATLGLKSESWGQLDFGRQTNIASKYLAKVASPFGPDWAQASVGSGFSAANSVRYDNLVMYQTPSFSGFQFGIGYSFNASGSVSFRESGEDDPNTRAWTTGIRYGNGPLEAALTYDQFKTPDNNNDEGVSVRAWALAASYDFEVVKVYAGFGQTRNGWFKPVSALGYDGNGQAELDSFFANDGMKVNSYTVGLSAPVGENGNVMFSWVMADATDGGSWGDDIEKQNAFSLGYTYALSKRTNIYALGSYVNNVAFNEDLKATQFAVGVRHQF